MSGFEKAGGKSDRDVMEANEMMERVVIGDVTPVSGECWLADGDKVCLLRNAAAAVAGWVPFAGGRLSLVLCWELEASFGG